MTKKAIPKRITEQKQFIFPPCEVCGEPSCEHTQDYIYHLDNAGYIDRGEPRDEGHWRCERHARKNRSLVMGADGQLHRYEPSYEEESFNAHIASREDSLTVIRARATPHTEEDKAFDRKW